MTGRRTGGPGPTPHGKPDSRDPPVYATCPGCRRRFVVPVPVRVAAVTCPSCRTRFPVGKGDRQTERPPDDPSPAEPPPDQDRPTTGG